VAVHAGFVGRFQLREIFPALMAGAALLAHRKGGMVAARRIAGPELIVRVVAVDAFRIVLACPERLAGVGFAFQLRPNLFMADFTLLCPEKVFSAAIDNPGVRVHAGVGFIAMTIQAGDLPMGRHMPARFIHQPTGASVTAYAD
jgi:hypothetical protein